MVCDGELKAVFLVVRCTYTQIRLLRAALRVLPLREWSLTRRFIQWITRQPDGILDVIDLSFLVKHVSLLYVQPRTYQNKTYECVRAPALRMSPAFPKREKIGPRRVFLLLVSSGLSVYCLDG